MRGKHRYIPPAHTRTGITPADAGKTFLRNELSRFARDHPRGCGENSGMAASRVQHDGSPPRMRGKPDSSGWIYNCVGITPADAGKTIVHIAPGRNKGDHPRGCGENNPINVRHLFDKGSPPRMRGKLFVAMGSPLSSRITPADAGKTSYTPRE